MLVIYKKTHEMTMKREEKRSDLADRSRCEWECVLSAEERWRKTEGQLYTQENDVENNPEGAQCGHCARLREAACHFVLHSVSVKCIPRAKRG